MRANGVLPRIESLSFSAIIMVGLLVFPLVAAGIIDASTIRNPDRPWTLP